MPLAVGRGLLAHPGCYNHFDMPDFIPVGKLPYDLLARLLARVPMDDPRILLGPGSGLDCAVIDLGDRLLALKSDPITFTADQIGWYAVQVNANDIATTGAKPRWMLATLLLPEGKTGPEDVEAIFEQVAHACRELGVSLIGGHTEVTHGFDRAVICGTMIGEVERGKLVSPRGAKPGDRLLLTKGVPVEAVSILAREFGDKLHDFFSEEEIQAARGYLVRPGISVVKDAQLALQAGRVTAMHDPTEGGLSGALWELAEACGHGLVVDPLAVPIPPLAARICHVFAMDPLASIASGALLMAVEAADAAGIIQALSSNEIDCAEIGQMEKGAAIVWQSPAGTRREILPRPKRDEITRVFQEKE